MTSSRIGLIVSAVELLKKMKISESTYLYFIEFAVEIVPDSHRVSFVKGFIFSQAYLL